MSKKVSPLINRIFIYNKYKNFWASLFKEQLKYKQTIYIYINTQCILKNLFPELEIESYFFIRNFVLCSYIFIIIRKNIQLLKKYFFIQNKYILYNILNKTNNYFLIKLKKKNKIYLTNLDIYNHFVQILKKKLSIKQIINEIFLMFGYFFTGIKIKISGRFLGMQKAHSEIFKLGNLSVQTLKLDVNFLVKNIKTKYGMIGIKIWTII